MINVGSDFSGVGAFVQSLKRIKVKYKTVFACDMDKYARQSYAFNYGNKNDVKEADYPLQSSEYPIYIFKNPFGKYYKGILVGDRFFRRFQLPNKFSWYYPENVYDRKIPKESLDIYMTSPPCQAFSLAGKRNGEEDDRGILFYNSHNFIKKNNPRTFVFENVKGLLSDAKGRTFQTWLDMLGGKSVNGQPVIFPREDAVPYHIYYRVINAKHYGVPQNRERVFIVGIRDDADNTFTWPKPFPLKKRLKDILEKNVDEKYNLSYKATNSLIFNKDALQKSKINPEIANTLQSPGNSCGNYKGMNAIAIKSATKNGYETATEGDSINLSNPNSKTRRGRVGKEVAQTLDTACNQSVMIASVQRSEEGKKIRKKAIQKGKDHTPFQAKEITFKESDVMNCVTTATTKDNLIKIGAIRGRGENNTQQLEINDTGNSNSITTVQKDNVVVQLNPSIESGGVQPYKQNRIYDANAISPVLDTECGRPSYLTDYIIRRLSPRECFRLMDFPDSYKIVVSDTQAYKQAGNSIVIEPFSLILEKIIKIIDPEYKNLTIQQSNNLTI